MIADMDIIYVTHADKDMATDCYYIASTYVGDADGLLYSIVPHVNSLHQPFFIAQSRGFIRGFLRAKVDSIGTNIVIQDLYIDNRFRRMGLGTKLMNAQINYAIANGARTLTLQARPLSVPFYEKMGFVRIHPQGHMLQKTL